MKQCKKLIYRNKIRSGTQDQCTPFQTNNNNNNNTNNNNSNKYLKIEIQRMWNVKRNMIPVIIGAAGTISKSLRQYPSNILGKQ